ncbi:unnamed protein product, partial [Prorocentrum cordatum]
QVFMEAHLLKRACVPGLYMNLLGQGVEIRDSSVSTHLCWAESRVCEVLQSESMYESDYCSTFRVFVIDKPLLGKYKTCCGEEEEDQRRKSCRYSRPPNSGPTRW